MDFRCNRWWGILLLWIWASNLMAAPSVPQTDVRIVVDVSGSMKKNDPNNLRQPALRLITNLLPPDSKAGVWTFGTRVKRLVALQKVDKAWQKKAAAATKNIHSRAQFTNIGDALQKAATGWDKAESGSKRSLILLTDGMVDISKNAEKNAAERQRILTDVLPKLQQAGATVHTIALSRNADSELLKQLSSSTDGWFLQVETADELERSFLKLFEQATQRDTVPLQNNRFSVDKNINEFTVLVFRKPGSAAALLMSPSGQRYQHPDNLGDNVAWYYENSYDLITITSPEAGEWSIEASIDPDNRVMIVSDLGLVSNELPNNLFVGEKLPISANLTNEGETITKKEFLMNVRFSVAQQGPKDVERRFQALDDGEDPDAGFADGIYSAIIPAVDSHGDWVVVTEAKSPTFQRRRQQAMKVRPIPFGIFPQVQQGDAGPALKIVPYLEWIKKDKLELVVAVTYPNGEIKTEIPELQDSQYLISLPELEEGQSYKLAVSAVGVTQKDRPFQVDIPAFQFDGKNEAIKPVENNVEIKQDADENVEPEAPSAEEDVAADEPEPEGSNMWLWISIAAVVNVLLAVGGFFLFKRMKKRKQQKLEAIQEALGE